MSTILLPPPPPTNPKSARDCRRLLSSSSPPPPSPPQTSPQSLQPTLRHRSPSSSPNPQSRRKKASERDSYKTNCHVVCWMNKLINRVNCKSSCSTPTLGDQQQLQIITSQLSRIVSIHEAQLQPAAEQQLLGELQHAHQHARELAQRERQHPRTRADEDRR